MAERTRETNPRQRGIRGRILWTGAEKVLVYGVNLVQGIVLARLLAPSDFGLAAIVGVFLSLGAILAEAGQGTALVVGLDGRVDARRVERRALALNVALACALYLGLFLFSPLVARFYRSPVLTPLLWVMALGLPLQAAGVVPVARLTRARAFGRLAAGNAVGILVGGVLGVGCAALGMGVWSIAALAVSGALVRLCALWTLARGPALDCSDAAPPARDPRGFAWFVRFGLKLMSSGMIHAVYTESYNVIIGRLWSPAAVGLFSRGSRWARLPGEVVNESVGRVALPYLTCRTREETLKFMIVACALLWPGLVLLGVFAPQVIGLVFGEKWLDCVPSVRILIVGQFFTPLSGIALRQICASGRGGLLLRTDAVKKPLGILALLVGLPFGIVGLCWAKVADDVVEAIVDLLALRGLAKSAEGGVA